MTEPKPIPANAEHGYFKIMRNHKERKERGELHPQSKLTPELVRLIRKDTRSNWEIAKQLGVTSPCIRAARLGITYAWVKDED